VGEMI